MLDSGLWRALQSAGGSFSQGLPQRAFDRPEQPPARDLQDVARKALNQRK